jgi:hypothetical protein
MATKTATIDYSMSLEQMVILGGKNIAIGITAERFPLPTSGITVFEPKIFSFSEEECYTVQPIGWYGIYTKDVIDRMAREGFRPAKIEELLMYRVFFKQEFPNGIVVALAAEFFSEADVDHQSKFVAILVPDSDYIGYSHCEIGWTQCHHFLGVKEVSSKS